MKLKIKLEGDDYVLGEAMIGLEATILFTLVKRKAAIKRVIIIKLSSLPFWIGLIEFLKE